MKERYIVFSSCTYYPVMGMCDSHSTHETYNSAIECLTHLYRSKITDYDKLSNDENSDYYFMNMLGLMSIDENLDTLYVALHGYGDYIDVLYMDNTEIKDEESFDSSNDLSLLFDKVFGYAKVDKGNE